jgi:hypothetical protein
VKRWPVILGRVGTVLIAIGLALFLVSLIPPAQSNFSNNGSIRESWTSYYETTLTPQQTLRVNVTANGTLDVYMLETSTGAIDRWIAELNPDQVGNVTYFDLFLEANSSLIAWQGKVRSGTIDHEYSPGTVVNVAFIVSSHGPDYVSFDYSVSVITGKAPAAKVQTLSEFAIPVGIVFTIPWLNELLRARRRAQEIKGKPNSQART